VDQSALIGPRSIRGLKLPIPAKPFPSPGNNWQDEVIYFLLPDRFSDGQENQRRLLDRHDKRSARGPSANWKQWAESGVGRWQGGRISGIRSKLPYLRNLGITVLWIGPVFRQREELNTYHGYCIQNFLEVEPRFGSKQDLVDLVEASHAVGIRVILDVIFNHSANNWVYGGGENLPPYRSYPDQLTFGQWRNSYGVPESAAPVEDNAGIWPVELQDANAYMRAGLGSLDSSGQEDPDDGTLEFRRSDFPPDGLRKFNHYAGLTLSDLTLCHKYWIGLTDCDGFRIDTVKHVTVDIMRAFAGSIKEFAASIGKSDFFLVAEIGGGDIFEREYLDLIDRHKLSAALDIGSAKQSLRDIARGLRKASDYFQRFSTMTDVGESRKLGSRLVSVLDDHDNISCERLRFSFASPTEHQVAAALAIQIFTLSIPCIYYGSEQGLSFNGPASDPGYEVNYLEGEGWGSSDRYLREAMFGPEHPLQDAGQGVGTDQSRPGFGPFGTSGFHCFDESNPTFVRVAHLLKVRAETPALRLGRQYQRPLGQFGWETVDYPPGEIVAWSRILDDRETVIAVNTNAIASRSADILVDFNLNPPGSAMVVIGNTSEKATVSSGDVYRGLYPVGSTVTVNRISGGPAYISLGNLDASEVVILGATGH
jgi:glycosidase